MPKRPKANKPPKGYKKRTPRRESSAQKLKKENARLRHELRKARAAHKATKKINALLQRFSDWKQAKDHRHNVIVHRKEIIERVHEIHELEEFDDYFDDYDREDLFDDLREEYDLTLDDWLDIMFEEGYTEHEAYELWYYP